ncbi:alpha/beta fold hydrolase [Roseovarius sp. SCSIO 43702]|uniref:alpha/beta hydrolase n=1 Tax=Roseovarius sp. SCSIO 43702 TaxID=2823043 RepID=UPI001C731142|nr:alpha/beta fold hydrolase [Roseovarius sp. SCSIO 43702]QYX58222.1 alpha/beta fold hydrolase [Roseovarius sp. SCSIO 43702]
MACVVLLGGCGERNIVRTGPPIPEAKSQTIYVAAQRDFDDPGPSFGGRRPTELSYARITVGIPPSHKTGNVEWPDETPDPSTDFVVTSSRRFPSGEAMRRDLRAHQGQRETVLFIHGYNNTMGQALFRFAQIKEDFGVDAPSVLFSWASAGVPSGYAYDRDSVLYARDDLEATLRGLSRDGEKVFILAHPMGAQLAMETMRQAAIRGDRQLLSRISGVALMSPDIDPQLFRRQARAIGQLPQPFFIFISREDRALDIASLITGRKPRLGGIRDPREVAGLDVHVVDFTALSNGEGLNHSIPVSSASAVGVVRGMIEKAESGVAAFERYLVLPAQP